MRGIACWPQDRADLGIKKLIIKGDSQLVVKQVNKDYQSPLMEAYVDEVRKLEERFDDLQAEHVARVENSIADDLSKRAALKLPVEPGTFALQLIQPSVEPSTGKNQRRNTIPRQVPSLSSQEPPARRLPGTPSFPRCNHLRPGPKP